MRCPHPKSINMTCWVSLLTLKFSNFMSPWNIPRRQHVRATYCTLHAAWTCQTKPSSNLPPWPSNKLRSYRLTDTRGPWPLSRWSCQSSSFIIPGALGPLLARSVRRSPQVGGSDDQARRWTVLNWFVYRKTICSLRLKFIWDVLNENSEWDAHYLQ